MKLADLTPEIIDNLEAGDAVDALIAEVVGVNLCTHHLDPFCATEEPTRGCYVNAETSCPEHGTDLYLWRPSRDWNAAMEAAERAIERFNFYGNKGENWMALQVCGAVDYKHKPTAKVYRANLGDSTTNAFAPTGPLAICKALLLLATKRETP